MPLEKEGKFNLFETERIEKTNISNILEHKCSVKDRAYTQCSMAKYQMGNVKVLMPIFENVALGSLFMGVVFMGLSILGGLEAKSSEFREWKRRNQSEPSDSL